LLFNVPLSRLAQLVGLTATSVKEKCV
jgi:hypothetical protein